MRRGCRYVADVARLLRREQQARGADVASRAAKRSASRVSRRERAFVRVMTPFDVVALRVSPCAMPVAQSRDECSERRRCRAMSVAGALRYARYAARAAQRFAARRVRQRVVQDE